MGFNWPVIPVQNEQKNAEENLVSGGYFRKYDTEWNNQDYFSEICEQRLGKKVSDQFVVQLFGCPLKCDYCLVQKNGEFGIAYPFETEELLEEFEKSKCNVFHLSGGAPANLLPNWFEIIDGLPEDKIFHSDLLLVERDFTRDMIDEICRSNCIYNVVIKGLNEKEFLDNTGVEWEEKRFWKNMKLLKKTSDSFYLTFVSVNMDNYDDFYEKMRNYGLTCLLDDSFIFDIG